MNRNVKNIVSEISDFLSYLTGLWGLVSAFTAFFPLVTQFKELIPRPQQHPDLCVLLATSSSIFIVVYKYIYQQQYFQQTLITKNFAKPVSLVLIYAFLLPNLPRLPLHELFGFITNLSFRTFFVGLIIAFWTLIPPALYVWIFYSFTNIFSDLAVYEWNKKDRR